MTIFQKLRVGLTTSKIVKTILVENGHQKRVSGKRASQIIKEALRAGGVIERDLRSATRSALRLIIKEGKMTMETGTGSKQTFLRIERIRAPRTPRTSVPAPRQQAQPRAPRVRPTPPTPAPRQRRPRTSPPAPAALPTLPIGAMLPSLPALGKKRKQALLKIIDGVKDFVESMEE